MQQDSNLHGLAALIGFQPTYRTTWVHPWMHEVAVSVNSMQSWRMVEESNPHADQGVVAFRAT